MVMDTSLIQTFFPNAKDAGQPGPAGMKGKDADSGTFFSLLKGSIGKDPSPWKIDVAGGQSRAGKQGASADALSRSLDVIDALAFLPVLLTMQPQAGDASTDGVQTQLYSGDTIKGFLGAIANALTTGNIEDVEKALKGNASLQALLSGQTGKGSTGKMVPEARSSADTAIADLLAAVSTTLKTGNISHIEKAVTGNETLTALIAGKQDSPSKAATGSGVNPGQQKEKDPAHGAITDLLTAVSTALKTGNINDIEKAVTGNETLAALISEAVNVANAHASGNVAVPLTRPSAVGVKDLTPALTVNAMGTGSPSERGKSRLSGAGKQAASAGLSTDAHDDVVRNTMLLGAMLPNLLTVKPQAEGAEATPFGTTAPRAGSLAALLAAIKADNGRGPGTDPLSGKGGAVSGQDLSPKQNQMGAMAGLSEDYVLLNAGKGDAGKDMPLKTGNLFEIVHAASGAGEKKTPDNSVTPFHESPEKAGQDPHGSEAGIGPRLQGAAGKEAARATASAAGPRKGSAPVVLPLSDVSEGEEALAKAPQMAAAASGVKAALDLKEPEEKLPRTGTKADAPVTRPDVNPNAREDAVKADAPQGNEGAGVLQKGSFAANMVHKIEQMAENFSSRNQSMDMVIRLRIDDKESVLVGLKDQGNNKVTVEVKGASDGLMSMLNAQKDAITKELESKHIYATIHVDPNGDNGFQRKERREQREQQEHAANKGKREDFGGILGTLA